MGILKRIFIPLNLVLFIYWFIIFPCFPLLPLIAVTWRTSLHKTLNFCPSEGRYSLRLTLHSPKHSCLHWVMILAGNSMLVGDMQWGAFTGRRLSGSGGQSAHPLDTLLQALQFLDWWRFSWLIFVKWCCKYTTADAGSSLKAAI